MASPLPPASSGPPGSPAPDAPWRAYRRPNGSSGEHHLRDFLRNANYLIHSAAPDGRLLFVNAEWTRVLGYTEGDVAAGLNVIDVIAPDRRDAARGVFERVLRGEAMSGVETVLVTRDGRRVTVEGETNARFDPAGEPIATRAIFRDVTAQRAAESQALLLETRYQAMVDVLGEGVTLVAATGDGDAVVEAVNASAARILGIDADQWIGQRLLGVPWRIVDEAGRDVPRERHPTLVALATGITQHEVVLGVWHGTERRRVWVSVSARPIARAGEPRPCAVVSSFRDVTEQRRVAAELQASEERYRHLFDGSGAAQIVVDAVSGHVVSANAAALDFYGCARDALAALSWPEPTGLPVAALARDMAGTALGERRYFRRRHRVASGAVRDVDVYATRTRMGDRDVCHATVHDVSERVRAEDELVLLQQVMHAISAAEDVTSAFLVALQSMCAVAHWGYGEAWLPAEPDADDASLVLVRGPAWCSPGDGAIAAFAAGGEAFRFAPGEGIPGRVWAARAPVWVADLAADANFPRAALAAAAGLRMGVGIPVLADGRMVAVLAFHDTEPSAEDGRRVEMLAAVAAQIGGVVARRRAEEERHESERRFRATLETVRAASVALDTLGRVTFANDFLLELTGWSRAEVLGTDWFERFVPDAAAARLRFQELIGSGDGVRHSESEILTRAGERRTISWDNTVLRDAAGRVTGTASLGQDVTDRARLARLKDELIGVASHELRTPLSAIHGSLRLLGRSLGNTLSQQDARLLEMAARNTQLLTRLVNDLLDVERIESGAEPIVPATLPVAPLLANVVELTRPLADAAAVAVRAEPAAALVWGDRDRVLQVLTNLVANALKFTPRGGSVTLAAAPEPGGEEVRLVVRDTGRGIPPDKLEAIFERFEQVESADARVMGGAGLGLSICRAIVRQHGGRIWAESVVGEGSVFSFTLPVATAG